MSISDEELKRAIHEPCSGDEKWKNEFVSEMAQELLSLRKENERFKYALRSLNVCGSNTCKDCFKIIDTALEGEEK